MKNKKHIIILLIGILLGTSVSSVFWYAKEKRFREEVKDLMDAYGIYLPENEAGATKDKSFPNFTLKTLSGDIFSTEDLEPKKTIVFLFASWCPYCHLEIEELQRLKEEYDDDFNVVMINLTSTEESLDNVKEYKEQYNITEPIVLDEFGDLSKELRVIGTPLNIFINSDGTVHDNVSGALSMEDLVTVLDRMN